jgi:uncharacterized damage-inducible protein DinB
MQKIYRKGAVGALLDEYERAIADLKNVIENIPDDALTIIIDKDTSDENCHSFQTILAHVVHSGFGYATSIHNLKGYDMQRPAKTRRATVKEYIDDLDNVFSFTENVLMELTDEELEQLDNALKIMTNWGQVYDPEQLMEHAIVHILRHRRQIEKFKKIRSI